MNNAALQKIGKSLANTFLAAVIALYTAGETDPKVLVNAGIAAVAVTLGRYLNPKDQSFGRKTSVPAPAPVEVKAPVKKKTAAKKDA